MEKLKSAINWFEIPATDFDRAVRFYSEIYAFDMPTHDMDHIKMGHEAMVAVKAKMHVTGAEDELLNAINRVEHDFRLAFPMKKWLFFEPDNRDN